ncbi:hypothetical protein [Candidatus Viridilinea mediisalina]|nr:hypothetical protein [Candidatus Viridilinea mediisalina]
MPNQVQRPPRMLSSAQPIQQLYIPSGRPLVILNGSTNGNLQPLYQRVRPLLQEGLAAWAARRGAVVITGGTNAGIFAVLGQGFARYGRPMACIGVAVAQLVQPPPEGVALEPNHTHMLLTEGQHWGAEVYAMYALAAAYGPPAHSLTIVVGGGPNTLRELEYCAAQGGRMLVVEGSGGVADALLDSLSGQRSGEERLQRLAHTAQIYRINLHAPPHVLQVLLDALMR